MTKPVIKDQLCAEVFKTEAKLVGALWSHPELYSNYDDDKLNKKHFGNKIWQFYFGLGKALASKKLAIFDDIETELLVLEHGAEKHYENFGGFDTISELMDEMKGKEDNVGAYYEEVKKYHMLRGLRSMFGDVVVEATEKYDYHSMKANEVHTYWLDKVVGLSFDDKKVDVQYLLEGLDEAIDEWDTEPDVGLPFYNSHYMTELCAGWALGNVYIFGGFGGKGKTSQMFNKIVMSCIAENVKLLIVANEQSKGEFQKLLMITAIGILNEEFDRKRLNKGGFTERERQVLKKAADFVRDISGDEGKLVAFAFLEDYSIDNLKNVIRHYANRGYQHVVIDTAKPSEGSPEMARWERFANDFDQIYKLARPDAGGLNLAIFANVQLADSALGMRYLDEYSFGDSKKIKNTASVCMHMRSVWDDERKDESFELKCYRWRRMGSGEPIQEVFYLDPNQIYYLLFVSKNRRGMDNTTGLDVLVLKPDFNRNEWIELGWTKVPRDRNYGR